LHPSADFEGGEGELGALSVAFSRCTTRLVVVVFRLDVAVEDFVLVHDTVDASRLLGLSGELKRDLKL
jgi:hypothetical protein